MIISDRYEVLFNAPFPELDKVLAKAYDVRDLHQTDNSLFVLRTSVFPPPRIKDFDLFLSLAKQSSHLRMLHLQSAFNTAWSEDQRHHSFALIYQRPRGAPVFLSLNGSIQPWSEDRVIYCFLTPITEILQEFQKISTTHRAIRPTNLFYDGNDKQANIILGECLSSPYGYEQGCFFEPLPYAMADPIGRGESTLSNDLFAVGATAAFLLLGKNPCLGKSEDEIIEERLENGSFATYVTKETKGSKVREALQGLLSDAPDQRWNLKDLTNWLNNGRHSVPLSYTPRRASRPISFNDRDDIYTTTLLAKEMRANPTASVELISKNDLQIWLKNSLKDMNRLRAVEDLKNVLSPNPTNSEKLFAVLQILQPDSPFFWQGRSMTGGGIAATFAKAVNDNNRIDSMVHFISSSTLIYYLPDAKSSPENDTPVTENDKDDSNNLLQQIQTAKMLLESKDLGGGVERCVYYLCPEIPCLSPIIKSYNCLKVSDILTALDHVSAQPGRPEFPLDRHTLSFIITHEKGLQQRFIFDIDVKSSQNRLIAMFKLLAELQFRYRVRQLPGLCRWLVEASDPIVNSYKNIKYRQQLKENIDNAFKSSNLSVMLKYLDNKKALEADRLGLRSALHEVSYIEKATKNIMTSLSSSVHYSERNGQNNAMMVSAGLSFIITCGYIVLKLL